MCARESDPALAAVDGHRQAEGRVAREDDAPLIRPAEVEGAVGGVHLEQVRALIDLWRATVTRLPRDVPRRPRGCPDRQGDAIPGGRHPRTRLETAPAPGQSRSWVAPAA